MSLTETEPRRYLYAERNMEELGQAFINDHAHMINLLMSGELPSPLDAQVMNQATIDMFMSEYLGVWESGKEIPKKTIKNALMPLRFNESASKIMDFANRQYIKHSGPEKPVEIMAEMAKDKVGSSLYERWSPFIMEAWLRRGASESLMPIYREFFNNRGQPYKGPSTSAVNESLINLASVSQVARLVKAKVLENPKLSEGQKAYFKSLDGLIAEYDAIVMLYEDIFPDTPGANYWHFPSPPNMDMGPNNTDKADIVSMRFKRGERIVYRLLDVKSKPIAKHMRIIGNVTRLTLADIGDVYVKNGEKHTQIGHRCDEFLADYDSMHPRKGVDDPVSKLARAATIFGVHLEGIDDYFSHRNPEGFEDDPEILKELGDLALH